MNNVKLEKFARLAVKMGVNVQKGQPLLISCPVEIAYFARLLVKEAYEAGASDVMVEWNDGPVTKMNYQYKTLETLKEVPQWFIDKANYSMDKNFL